MAQPGRLTVDFALHLVVIYDMPSLDLQTYKQVMRHTANLQDATQKKMPDRRQ